VRLRQPRWPSLLPARLVTACATLGPLGRRMPAPGTWGSLAGLAVFAVFLPRASAGLILAVSVVAGYLAVGICGEAERRLGKRDPGEVILDEFVVMPLCLLGWSTLAGSPPFWVAAVAAFALFRLFDIVKPLGIARLQELPGGWGVVADDFAAALAACATLHLGAWGWSLR
jgi:phosphatidylglycerophosphatase A